MGEPLLRPQYCTCLCLQASRLDADATKDAGEAKGGEHSIATVQ